MEVSPQMPAKRAVIALAEEEPEGAGEDEEKVYGAMKKGLRKRVQKSMDKIVVSQVFSEPRVAEVAEERGPKKGTSLDLI